MLEKIKQKLEKKRKKDFKFYFKKYRFYLLGFLVFTCLFSIFLLLKPIMVSSWMEYPLDLRGKIAFNYYIDSYSSPCRSNCLTDRKQMSEIIVKAWLENKSYWDGYIFGYLKNIDDIEIKKALVDLSRQVYVNEIPVNLEQIVYSQNYSYDLRHYIIKKYSHQFSSDNDLNLKLVNQVISNDLSSEQRLSAMQALYAWPSRDNFLFSLSILDSQESLVLKETALDLINAWPKNNINLKESDLEFLSELSLREDLDKNLRVKIVWLITDYYNLYAKKVLESLNSIYEKESIDNISRGFSAEAINYLSDKNLELPSISEKEWQNYYQTY